jgi:hypothetical protein
MNKNFKITIVLLAILLTPFLGMSQCKNFAKKTCKTQLLPYVHDGVFNATVLSEGETAELYKTFYSGQQYRISICSADELPPIQFQIMDGDRHLLYDNKKDDYAKYYDFKLDASQQLIIAIQVQTKDELADKIMSGCVAVLVGFMNVENKLK